MNKRFASDNQLSLDSLCDDELANIIVFLNSKTWMAFSLVSKRIRNMRYNCEVSKNMLYEACELPRHGALDYVERVHINDYIDRIIERLKSPIELLFGMGVYSGMPQFDTVRYLELRDTRIDKSFVKYIHSLERLVAFERSVEGELLEIIIEKSPRLKTLKLLHLCFNVLPKHIETLCYLEDLTLQSVSRSSPNANPISMDTFKNMKQLRKLSLKGYDVRTGNVEEFSNLRTLEVYNVKNWRLILNNSPNLKNLIVEDTNDPFERGTCVVDSDFAHVPKLETLHLTYNHSITGELFNHLPNLIEVELEEVLNITHCCILKTNKIEKFIVTNCPMISHDSMLLINGEASLYMDYTKKYT